MSAKVRAYLELVRIPNVFTAVADPVAGFLYMGGQLDAWARPILLGLTSAFLYSGGIALNDVCDIEADARIQPRRPIPSGRVSRRTACALVTALMGMGTFTAFLVSIRTLLAAVLLVIAIILYNAFLKHTVFAATVMGLCRLLNLALGMSAVSIDASAATLAPLVLMWMYVASLTHFARREAGESERWRLVTGTIGVCVAVGGLLALVWLMVGVHSEFVVLALALLIIFGYGGIEASIHRDRTKVGLMVSRFVGGIVLFDACIVWAARGPALAAGVAALLIPTLILQRSFRMT